MRLFKLYNLIMPTTCITENCSNLRQGRYRHCSRCIYNNKRKTCECGVKMNPQSTYCIKCSNSKNLGASNGNWKGGKTTTSKGYTLRTCKNHPRATKNGSYVLEHILVMEEHLGRLLEPNENVHHKNTLRNDNNLSNLELWVTSQPSGGRVSDITEWAVEHLKKYAPKLLSEEVFVGIRESNP